jgi:dihydroflavonol-4-reductase
MSRVIITGANGFLGSWLTRRLLAEGHEVFALVRKSSDLAELDGVNCQYLFGDVTDPQSLDSALLNMDTVFHAAGLVAYTAADRPRMEQVNVQGTQNVIDSCLKLKVRRLVHISSVVAVGAGFDSNELLSEKSPYNVRHLNLGYFETKRRAEELVIKACNDRDLDAVILNPSTIYGPGDARKGSRKIQVKVARGEFKFYTSGGVNVVAIEDVIEGIIQGWKVGQQGERYILCGENILIKDLFALIAETAGQRAPTLLLPNFLLHGLGTLGDILSRIGLKFPISRENAWTSTLFHWFNCAKARRDLNYKPSSSRLAVQRSVQWMKENNYLS